MDDPTDWQPKSTTWLIGELCRRLSRRIANERHQNCANCNADKELIVAAQEAISTLYDSKPMHGSGPITRAEMTCVKCGTVFSIWNETAQAVHFETGLCKACIRGAK